jgi:alpha-1,3-glucosyltransferase
VHEKAIVMVLLPITPFAFYSRRLARVVLLVLVPATFAQFPLFQQTAETPTKVLLLLIFGLYAHFALQHYYRQRTILTRLETLYLLGLVVLQCFNSFALPSLQLHSRWPFLPLLLTSLYTSIAIIYTWIVFYADSLANHF